MTEFPQGNGDPTCDVCKGRGVISTDIPGFPGGSTQNCGCVYRQDLRANVKRVWKLLLLSESVESSPLMGCPNQNLWITATEADLQQHLRYVAFRMGPYWNARVISDASLITAWLSTAKNIKDPDVTLEKASRNRPSDEYMTIVDLALPFDLLIIRLGVKAAKNREMPGVLAEAISERSHIGKPTWIVDSPAKPLQAGHVCWDDRVAEHVWDWKRVVISTLAPEPLATLGGGFYAPSLAPTAPTSPRPVNTPPDMRDVGEGAYERPYKSPLDSMAITKEDGERKRAAAKRKKARGGDS